MKMMSGIDITLKIDFNFLICKTKSFVTQRKFKLSNESGQYQLKNHLLNSKNTFFFDAVQITVFFTTQAKNISAKRVQTENSTVSTHFANENVRKKRKLTPGRRWTAASACGSARLQAQSARRRLIQRVTRHKI